MARLEKVETLVIGAGVVGSSVAMHLTRLGMKGVRVVDFDLEGSLSSSELNAGGVRATWYQPVNVGMSKASIEYFASVAEDVGYRACGYLWLQPKERLQEALKAREMQIKMGWPVESWDLATLKRRVPFIDKTAGIEGCIFAPRDGLVNPNLLKNHYREKARAAGAVFEDRIFIRQAVLPEKGGPVRIVAEQLPRQLSAEDKSALLKGEPTEVANMRTPVEYQAEHVVNCAGPWAGQIAATLGYLSPCFPVRRQVCVFDCRDVDLTPYGMIVDTSGVYFHPEASNGLAGFATRDERPGVNFDYDGEAFFTEHIWPALYERSTAFERLKHLTGWAGLYDVSPDESAIVGRVEVGDAGRTKRIFEVHSFSGHGVMHSYAAGEALAELIVRGRYETLDLTALGAKRFETGQSIPESLVI